MAYLLFSSNTAFNSAVFFILHFTASYRRRFVLPITVNFIFSATEDFVSYTCPCDVLMTQPLLYLFQHGDITQTCNH